MNFVKSTFFTHRFKNGVRLIHQPSSSSVAHCGVVINVGTRDELTNEHGMAHLLEHMAFKGTKNRKPFHIISRIEDVGGEIDAYTTKEMTCYYSSFLHRHYQRTLELLSDITFNAIFPEKEIKKEKSIVLEEINMYRDSPSELIFDDFEELLFGGHPIGRNTLGTPESVKDINREDIRKFRNRTYNTNEMVICSVGNINPEKLIRWSDQYFGKHEACIRNFKRESVKTTNQFSKTLDKNTYQAHCITGLEAYDHTKKEKHTLQLIANLLGGPAMNTRLNLALREKKGLAYHTETFYSPYSDSGIFGIYFGTDKKNISRCLDTIFQEIKKLQNKKLGTIQMSRARNQLTGQIAISAENSANLMLALGKNMLFFNTSDTVKETIQRVDNITAENVLEVSNQLFDKEKFSTLIFK